MTIYDLRCDGCGRGLPMPGDGIRFVYHPGVPQLRDDSGLACGACWESLARGAGGPDAEQRCARCGGPVPRRESLHVRRVGDPQAWRLCAQHAVEFLNALRTVQPKLDPAAFRFPGQRAGRPEGPTP